MTLTGRCGAALLLAGLSGCVVAPLPQAPLPLVAVPGSAKTAAAFQQDDTACRAEAASPAAPAAPGQPSAPAQGGQSQDEAASAGGVYLHCMEARNNVVQPIAVARPAVYGYYPYYGPYGGYGPYPWLYDGYYPGFYGIYGFYGGYYGWHGGYGYGYGFHGGYGGYGGGHGGGGRR